MATSPVFVVDWLLLETFFCFLHAFVVLTGRDRVEALLEEVIMDAVLIPAEY